jgi:hypothetical protein
MYAENLKLSNYLADRFDAGRAVGCAATCRA